MHKSIGTYGALALVFMGTTIGLACFTIIKARQQNERMSELLLLHHAQIAGLQHDVIWVRSLEQNAIGLKVQNTDITDTLGNTVALHDIIASSDAVFRVFESACEPCLAETFTSLSKFTATQIAVVGRFYSIASHKYFARQYNLSHCYMLKGNIAGSAEVEQNEIPYLFRTTSDYRIASTAIPLKNFPQYAEGFLDRQ